MTEAEWLGCTDPVPMLQFLRGTASDRKLRLFAVAVARLLWDRMNVEQRAAVEVGERLADGLATGEERLHHVNKLYEVYRAGSPADPPAHMAATKTVGCWKPGADVASHAGWVVARQATSDRQPALLRDIFGNPFRPVTVDPSWLTLPVVSLAEEIYPGRAFDRMPILGSALQEAGCGNADVRSHCRSECPHVRGCWAIDLLLGKA
jgi:hypothetical protein